MVIQSRPGHTGRPYGCLKCLSSAQIAGTEANSPRTMQTDKAALPVKDLEGAEYHHPTHLRMGSQLLLDHRQHQLLVCPLRIPATPNPFRHPKEFTMAPAAPFLGVLCIRGDGVGEHAGLLLMPSAVFVSGALTKKFFYHFLSHLSSKLNV